jgi:hypothetical protein
VHLVGPANKVFSRNSGKLHEKNLPQKGVRGIWVGYPINQAGALIWVNQTNLFIVSADYTCDEDFHSPLADLHLQFHDATPVRTAPDLPLDPIHVQTYYTGPPLTAPNPDTPDDPWALYPDLAVMHPAEPIADTNFYVTDLLSKEGKEPLSPLRNTIRVALSITSAGSHITDNIEILEQPSDHSLADADPMNQSHSPVDYNDDSISALPDPLPNIDGPVIQQLQLLQSPFGPTTFW